LSLFNELKRRNVFRVGIAYVLMGWVLLQAADFAMDLIAAPNWVIQSLSVAVVIGLPVALFFAWAFELTPEGIQHERDVDRSQPVRPGKVRTLNVLTIGFLVLVIAIMGIERFVSVDKSAPTNTSAVERDSAVSIAVLPFVNMSSDPEQEYFSDGITEEILNRLAKIKELQVTARTSAFSFKGQNQDIREIAGILGVETILEGSVRRDGELVRITAQLIRASDGFHLWSETYDRKLESIFAVQDEIAGQITSALKISLQLTDTSATAIAVNPEAFDLYLRARALYRQRGIGLLESIELFRQSIAIDPGFAPAWAGLSQVLGVVSAYVSQQDMERIGDEEAQSMEAARKALELDPSLPLVQHAMASSLLTKYRWAEAQEHFLRAIQLDPDSTELMEDYAHFLVYIWQPDQALIVVDRMLELDPLVPVFQYAAITTNDVSGDISKRDEHINIAMRLNPDMTNIQVVNLTRLLELGNTPGAHSFVDQMDLSDWVSRESMHRLVDWIFNSSGPLDESLTDALRFYPRAALIAGRYDLWKEYAFGLDRLKSWESLVARLAIVTSPANEGQYRDLLSDADIRRVIEMAKLPEYWREAGWPEQCQPVGDNDFVCK
jgi:TolB-like protein